MNMRDNTKKILAVSVSVLALSAMANAQDSGVQDGADTEIEFEEIVVSTGFRGKSRTVAESLVPIDVFGSNDLGKSGHIETARLLQQLAPSFGFGNNTISDGSDVARPANLRGLGPDQVLVLINGKRNVGQAWLNITQSAGSGTTGVDLNAIPAAAIERIEVLRDGASSQYGSDAIAGVVNIILKSHSDGAEIRGLWGQTYEGDGETYSISVNKGFEIGDGGFLNLTVERRDRGATNRAGPSSRTFVGPGAAPQAGNILFRIGDAAAENWQFMGNSMVPLGDDIEAYAFAKYMKRDGESGGFYRWPFQADRSVPQVFPDGFLVGQVASVEEYGVTGGMRWENASGLTADVSVSYGMNELSIGANQTINASIAAEYLFLNPGATDAEIAANAGPTSGNSGAVALDQLVINADFSLPVDIGTAEPLNLAFGYEYRDESYEIKEGDFESYSCGSFDAAIAYPSVVDPAATANCGFQGLPGYSPAVAGTIGRNNHSFYLDLDARLTEAWSLAGALRYEDYSSVGEKLTGKVSTRYQVDQDLALRATVSSGFRAASLPQAGFTSIVTQIAGGGLSQTLVANSADQFTEALGLDGLDFETSMNYSIGLVWGLGDNLNLTIDAYQIDIDDRIVLGQPLTQDTLNANGLSAAAAVLAARGLDAGRVFSNAIDTRTQGVDAVLTHNASLFEGDLTTTLAFAYTKTEITDQRAPGSVDPDSFFDSVARSFVEDINPNVRTSLTFDYSRDWFSSLVRFNYYGSTSTPFFSAALFGCENNVPCGPVDPFGIDPSTNQVVDSALLIDVELAFEVSENVTFAIGANNILNKRPNELSDNSVPRWITDGAGFGGPGEPAFGNFVYPWRGVAYGINGGFYYLRAKVNF